MKYLVAPTQEIGKYWAKSMGLKPFEYKTVSKMDDIRGRMQRREDFIFVENEPFDFPPVTSEFYHFVNRLEFELKIRFG